MRELLTNRVKAVMCKAGGTCQTCHSCQPPVPAASRVPTAAERSAVAPLRLHSRQQRIHVLQAAAMAAGEVVGGMRQEGQLAQRAPAETVCCPRHLQ